MPCGCNICDPETKHTYCICGPNWDIFDDTIQSIKNLKADCIAKQFSISTITVCAQFNTEIDIETLSNIYFDRVKFNPKCKKVQHQRSSTTRKSKKNNNDEESLFYNSLIMKIIGKYQDFGFVSIKFFPNGKIQIAGCKTIKSCAYAIRKAFSRVFKNDCFVGKPKITDAKIAMINTDFKINFYLDQDDMCTVLNEFSIHKNKNFTQINYQNCKYPAINAKAISLNRIDEFKQFLFNRKERTAKRKFPNVVSVLIFRPGSIILTGGCCIKQYLEIYTVIVKEIIEPNIERIKEKM